MAPKMPQEEIARQLQKKKGKEKTGQAFPVVHELNSTPDTSTTQSNPSRKRTQTETEVIIPLPPVNPPVGSFNPGGASGVSGSYSVGEPDKGLAVFKDVIEEGEMSSI